MWKTNLQKEMYTIIKVNSLRTDGDFCHQGWDTEIAPPPKKKNLR
jgi:hypothetical protein